MILQGLQNRNDHIRIIFGGVFCGGVVDVFQHVRSFLFRTTMHPQRGRTPGCCVEARHDIITPLQWRGVRARVSVTGYDMR